MPTATTQPGHFLGRRCRAGPGRRGRLALGLGALLLAAWWTGWTGEQTAARAASSSPPFRSDILLVAPEASGLRAAVWVDRGRYALGEPLEIHFFVSEPAYVVVYGIDGSGQVRLVFPNRFEMTGRVPAGTRRLPGPSAGYALRVAGPPGPRYLQLVATRRPYSLAAAGAFAADPFPVLSPDAPAFKARLQEELGSLGAGWTAAWTAFWAGTGQNTDPQGQD